MQRQDVIRTFLFIIFFSVGGAALAGSILCNELFRYYQNLCLKSLQQAKNRQLESLIVDYDVLLKQFENDPNFVSRLAPALLGTEPNEPDTVYPEVSSQLSAAVKEALRKDSVDTSTEFVVPQWLSRCSDPVRRTTVFIAGVFLILVSFICFGPTKHPKHKELTD